MDRIVVNTVGELNSILSNPLVMLVAAALLFMLVSGRLTAFLRSFKKIKAGPVELDGAGADDAKTCPHQECYAERKGVVQDLLEQLERLTKMVEVMQIDQLKLVFYNKDMPEEERMAAGLRYIHAGRNHQMRLDALELARSCPITYRTLVALMPELHLEEADVGKAHGV